MGIDTSIINDDIGAVLADLPTTVTISGWPYEGQRTNLDRSDVLASEGLRDQYRFSVYLRASELPSEPAISSTVTVNRTTFWVISKQLDPTLQLLRLDLGETDNTR